MIDNPIPQQRMEEMDQQYMAEQFYEDFAEYFADVCRESDDGYSLTYSKDLIDDWWEENSYIYDTFKTPYMEKN